MSGKRKTKEDHQYPSKHPTYEVDESSESEDDDPKDNAVIKKHSFLKHGTQCGVIEAINLKQFMCHKHFSIKFCPNLNYVVGKNGSGKSAIMTAIVVGLGGTAVNTSRGSSVKSFIQQGKQVSEINIKLRNTGQDAYKPEVYGESIQVQRIIRAKGNSSYNIKNSSGKIISNHKSELNFILDHFNIQVDNPISILNQDLSRQFLRTEDPKSKYKFFMKATLLEQISKDYIWIDKNKSLAKEYLGNKKMAIPGLEKELEKWKIKHDLILSIDDLKLKQESLNGEYAWAMIAGLEKELQVKLNKLEALKSRRDQLTTKITTDTDSKNVLENDYKTIKAEMEEIKTDLDTLQPRRQQTKNMHQDLRKGIQQQRTRLETLSKQIRNVTMDRDRLVTRIKDLQSAETNKTATEKANRLQKLTELQNHFEELQRKLQSTQTHADKQKYSRDQLITEMNYLRNEGKALSVQLQAACRKLQTAETARGDRQKRFGQWVPEALNEIEKAYQKGLFRQKPIGPLGLYIKIRDPKWTLAVETCLKQYLFAFICENNEDERKLERTISGLLKKYNSSMPMVITSQFQSEIYDVSRHCVHCEEFPSVLDILDVDNPVVLNCLIDQRGIECVLLLDDDKANNLMLHRPPRNCNEAYTTVADQLYPSPYFRIYSNRNTRVEFFKDIEDNITALHSDIADIKRRIQANNGEIHMAEDQQRSIVTEFKEAERNVMQIRSNISKITIQINELRSVEEEEPVYFSALEGDLKIFDEQLEGLNSEYNNIEDDKKSSELELKRIDAMLKQIDQELNSKAKENLVPLKEKLVVLSTDIEEICTSLKHYEARLLDMTKQIQDIESVVNKSQSQIDRYTTSALERMPRPEEIRDENEIQSEQLQLSKCLEEEESLLESKEVIMRQYIQVLNKFKSVKQDIDVLERFLKKIERLMSVRKRNFNQFQKALGIRVSQYFALHYQVRNCGAGIIDIDHNKEILSISVQPNGKSAKAQTMASLSGGERSFSTVAFILALWEAIGSPFRMLDEFDVYMDLVNRRHSMEILHDFAKSHPFCQFVFFTPLELPELQASNDLRIYKMQDPERNQGTLPFMPMNDEV